MKAELDSLKDYQDVITRIAELDRLLAMVPPEVQSLEDEWKSIQSRIEELNSNKAETEAKIRELNAQHEEQSTKAQKYEKDLQAVTNSKEYNAVLKEIDMSKKKLHNLNEDLTARKKELEEIDKNLEECTQLEAESRKKFDEAMAVYKESQAENTSEREEKDKLRAKLEAKVPQRLLRQFNRIRERRNGIGLALCVSATCSACNVRIRQKVVDELRQYKRLFICESCKRILYFSEENPS